jgi:hypothetical protein
MDFVARNSNKLQKLGFKGKISCPLNVFTLPNFKTKLRIKVYGFKEKILITPTMMGGAKE